MRQCLGGRRSPSENPEDEAVLQRRLEGADGDQGLGVSHVSQVEALELRFHPALSHRGGDEENVVEGVEEDEIEDEGSPALRVLGVVHRSHVQGGDFRARLPQILDSLFLFRVVLHAHVEAARREVDHHRAALLHLFLDLAMDLRRPGLFASDRIAGMDVHDGCTGVAGAARLFADFGGGVGEVRALVAVGDHAGECAGDDHPVLGLSHPWLNSTITSETARLQTR